MTQVAYRNRGHFLEISQPKVITYRPSVTSRVVIEPWLERSCRLEAVPKLKNPVSRSVPVKLIDRNSGATKDYIRLAQKNTLAKARNSSQTRCANSELQPWKGGRSFDVRGKSFNLSSKNKVIVETFSGKTKDSVGANGTPMKSIPRSKSECKFYTEIVSPCSDQLRYSVSGLTVKAPRKSKVLSPECIRISSEAYRGSKLSKDSTWHEKKPYLKVAFSPSLKSQGESNSSYMQLQAEADYLLRSRAASGIRNLGEKNYYSKFWKPESGRVHHSHHVAKTDLQSARQKLCCSPVSNNCGRDDYCPIHFRQYDQTDAKYIPVGHLQSKDLRSSKGPLSTKMLSAHGKEGAWASAVNKTHYILQWLADVNSEAQDQM